MVTPVSPWWHHRGTFAGLWIRGDDLLDIDAPPAKITVRKARYREHRQNRSAAEYLVTEPKKTT
jgi:hypothetical protein